MIVFVAGNDRLSLTNPDEVFYSLSAEEMMQHNEWLTPLLFDQPQFEKPILTFWLLRLSFEIFGIHPFAARLPPAVFAVAGCWVAYLLGKILFKEKTKAFLSAVILMTAGLYMGMARFLLTDMIFSVLIFAALACFYWSLLQEKRIQTNVSFLLFFIISALAVLTKGILGFVIPAGIVMVFLCLEKRISVIFNKTVGVGFLLFGLISLPWYWHMISRYDGAFIHEFFYNDHIRRLLEAEHRSNDTWYFYPLVITAGMMPWSLFMIRGILKLARDVLSRRWTTAQRFLFSWIGVVFAIFQCAHSKLASYILPMFPALAFITADEIGDLVNNNRNKTLTVTIIASCLPMLVMSMGLFLLAKGTLPFEFNYYRYLPDEILITQFLIIVLLAMGAAAFLAARRRPHGALLIMALQIPLLLGVVLLSKDRFEDYVSSRHVSRYLMARIRDQNSPVLCSKMFVRGVRYYTGMPVAVLGKPFFSPHPIPTLIQPKEILEFFQRYNKIWAVVREKDKGTLMHVLPDTFEIRDHAQIADAFVLEINKVRPHETNHDHTQ